MTKGLQLMRKIARLAREAQGLLPREEDRQVAVEIKLAAECVVNAEGGTRNAENKPRAPHHD